MRHALLAVSTIIASALLHADDGAASIAAGGIVVLSRETRITMAKEVLQISDRRVVVDYDFRNDTDQDVTTEVAFPIPPYDLAMEDVEPARQGFDDFKLWVNGSPVDFRTQTRAFIKRKDITGLLEAMHIDIGSFGHATSNDDSPDIARLSPNQRAKLLAASLIDPQSGSPLWQVHKKYYWQQTFPARSITHIRHVYTPVVGSTNSIRYGLGRSADPQSAKDLKDFCIEGKLDKVLRNIAKSGTKDAPYWYVDFILTSANTWKTPIEEFTLIVERPHAKEDIADYVSFCWDGPVTKPDPDHFEATATNFIPRRELKVGFFGVEKARF